MYRDIQEIMLEPIGAGNVLVLLKKDFTRRRKLRSGIMESHSKEGTVTISLVDGRLCGREGVSNPLLLRRQLRSGSFCIRLLLRSYACRSCTGNKQYHSEPRREQAKLHFSILSSVKAFSTQSQII